MSRPEIRRVGESVDRLGEGLLWDARAGVLYWVDSIGCLIHRLDPATGERRDWPMPSEIGSIVLRRQGGLLAALRDGLYAVDLPSGSVQAVNLIRTASADQRFNDGKIDRQGRWLVGTMHESPPADRIHRGRLYRIDHDLRATVLEEAIGCANGQCFSPDGRIFYFTDSPRRKIFAYDYDLAAGTIANKRVLVDTAPFGSVADGQTVDAEGYLWAALLQAGKVVRFDPAGRVDRVVEMPAEFPTNVGFGGPALATLYVTSLKRTPNMASERPGAGWLFAVDGLGVRGLAEPLFAG
jgi:sugar lactone lactonase YvrE